MALLAPVSRGADLEVVTEFEQLTDLLPPTLLARLEAIVKVREFPNYHAAREAAAAEATKILLEKLKGKRAVLSLQMRDYPFQESHLFWLEGEEIQLPRGNDDMKGLLRVRMKESERVLGLRKGPRVTTAGTITDVRVQCTGGRSRGKEPFTVESIPSYLLRLELKEGELLKAEPAAGGNQPGS